MLAMWIVVKKCPMSVPWKWGAMTRNVCLELSIPLFSRSTKDGGRITHNASMVNSPIFKNWHVYCDLHWLDLAARAQSLQQGRVEVDARGALKRPQLCRHD